MKGRSEVLNCRGGWIYGHLFAGLLLAGPLLADPPPSPSSSVLQLAVDDGAAAKAQSIAQPPPMPLSDAERISRLQRSIEADEGRHSKLFEELNGPDSAYAKAEAEFQKLDDELAAIKRELQEASVKQDVETIQAGEVQMAELTRRWTLAKDRFQLEIEQRKTHQEVIATLETKLQKDREALGKLRGVEPMRPVEEPGSTPLVAAPTPPVTPPAAVQPLPSATVAASMTGTTVPIVSQQQPAVPAVGTGTPVAPGAAAAVEGASPDAPPPPPASLLVAKPDPRALSAATEAATKSAEDAAHAEREAASITERVAILRADIALQRKLKDFGRKKVDKAEDALRELNDELTSKLLAGQSVDEVGNLIGAAQDRLHDATIESRSYSTRLDELQTELAGLLDEEIAAMREAEKKRQEAHAAQLAVDELNNPFSSRHLLWWLGRHGSAAFLIVLIVALVLHLSRKLEGRFVALLAGNSRRGGHEERTNRAKTLVTVMQNLVRTVAIGTGIFMTLDEVGLPISPLLGGAAVIGLAAAFGAQSLIKDYFTGFMVLMEQQYVINDVIRIGDITGQVERITLRMTVLRDLEGRVHFVPHGQIDKVTNLTHGWSRAVFDISVGYKEDVDRCIEQLTLLSVELWEDPRFGAMILEQPQMLGVDALGESGVVIKFVMKTRPLRQWDVKREMLRRIKNRFDQLGIEIPFPQRTLHLRSDHAAQESGESFQRSMHRKSA